MFDEIDFPGIDFFGVKPFRNRDNYAKYLLFYHETGTTVILQTLRWLYQDSIEDIILKLPKNRWNATENNMLDELKGGRIKVEDLDFSLLYKITQISGKLAPENDIVWNKRCPPDKHDELEHLLFILKDGRNNLAHPSKKERNITDLDVKTKSDEMKDLLTSIVEKAGQRSNVDISDVNEMVNFVESDILRIYRNADTDTSISHHVKNLIMQDLKSLDDDSSFESELKGYSLPYFQSQDDQQTSFQLNDIFTILEDTTVVVVTGEAGYGKSALTRFLSNSWREGKTDKMNQLATFECVLRVECKHINSRDVSQFLEDHLPTASFSFQNTSSLKRNLIPFELLWIMDGYDERTPEFKGFLNSILQELSAKHKIIITTRPNILSELQKFLSGIEIQTLSLEKLKDDNIDEILSNLIDNADSRAIFKSEFDAIDDAGKCLLRTPLNMTLYIELWLNDPKVARNYHSTEILYTKVTHNQLRLLTERLEGKTTLSSSEDLIMNLNNWFYRYLCRETFVVAFQRKYIIPSSMNGVLKKTAINSYLIPADCLSAFLIRNEENDYCTDYDFQHPTQILVLASIYMKNMEEYPDEGYLDYLKNVVNFKMYSTYKASLDLIQFYMKVITADNSITQNTKQIFFSLNKVIPLFESNEQFDLWLETSSASNFNTKFMSLVSQTLQEFPYWAIQAVNSYSEVAKFLSFVKLKKIKLRVSNTFQPSEAKEFIELIDILREKQIEVHIHTIFETVDNIIGTSVIDKINEISLNITSFTGTMTEFNLIRNHHKNLKSLELIISSENDLLNLCEFLKEDPNLFEIKLYLNCEDSYVKSTQIQAFPESYINMTTLVMANLNRKSFKKGGISLLTHLKGDNTLKFKCFILPLENRLFVFSKSEENILLDFAKDLKDDPNENCLGMLDNVSGLQIAREITEEHCNSAFGNQLDQMCTIASVGDPIVIENF